MSEFIFTNSTGYGAPEIKASSRDYLARGLLISLILHVMALITYRIHDLYFAPEERTIQVNLIDKYAEIIPFKEPEPQPDITYQAPKDETGDLGLANSSPSGFSSEVPETAGLAGSQGAPARMNLAAELDDLGIGTPVAAPPRVAARGTGVTDTRVVTRDVMPTLKETDTTLDGDLNLDGASLQTTLPGQARGRGFGGNNSKSTGILLGSGGNAAAGIGSGSGVTGNGSGAVDAGLGVPGGNGTGGAGRGQGSTRGRAVNEATAKVTLKNLEQLGDYNNFTPIYRALVEWMRKHPAEFSDVVNRFMGHQPGNLTASVKFVAGGRQFEIFLLCVDATYEIRVCMAEGNNITYLIDQGFKKQSNYLRTGTLERQPNGDVLLFGSVMREASDRRTQEFYQIFLSWWDTVKGGVGG
jgi:hypothetical protein